MNNRIESSGVGAFNYYRWPIKQQLHTVVLQKHGKGKFNEQNPVSFLHIFVSLEATK